MGAAKWYDHCLNALTTEALACKDGDKTPGGDGLLGFSAAVEQVDDAKV